MALRECPNCRASVDDVNPFCSECGTRLNAAPTAAEGPTQALPRYDGQGGSFPPPEQNYGQAGSYPPPPQQNYGQAGSYPPPPQQNYGQAGSYPPPPQQNYGQGGSYPPPPQQNYGQGGSYPPPPQQNYGNQQQYTPANYQQPNYGAAYPNAGAPTKRSSNTGIVIGIVVGILVLIGAGVAFLMDGDNDDPNNKLVAGNATSVATATARPTRTPAAEATEEPEAPTSEPSTGGLAFLEDDFSTTDEAWPDQETASKSGKYAYVEDAYQIHVYVNERIIWTSTNETYSDVDAQIDVKMVSGDPTNAAGLVLREQIDGAASGSLYVYQIDGQGNIAFRRYDKQTEEWTNLVDWKFSSVANDGIGATNRLRVVAVGSNFTFYLNGEKVATYNDDTYANGAVGFGASTFDNGDTLTEFDNLRMAYP